MSNPDEPPRETTKPPSTPSSTFSSLPNDLVLEILARVPKRYHPILKCVCKNFTNFLRSREFQKTRSRLDLDSLYICFTDDSKHLLHTRHWSTLRRNENDPDQNRFESVAPPYPSSLDYSFVIAIGPEIYFFCESTRRSSIIVIFDSRSGKLRYAPDLQVERLYKAIGLIGEKLYVIGGCNDADEFQFQAESFDLKKQIWKFEVAPNLIEKGYLRWKAFGNVSVDRKVISMSYKMTCYDPRDGSCEVLELVNGRWWDTGVCVIENVLYVYYSGFGLMWFDSKGKVWRVVDGLSVLKKACSVGMAEYYGKLAFLWTELGPVGSGTKEIWCRMIGLERSGDGIFGVAEPSQLLGVFPKSYMLKHCLSVSV